MPELRHSDDVGFQRFRRRITPELSWNGATTASVAALDRHSEFCDAAGMLPGPLHRSRAHAAQRTVTACPRIQPSKLNLASEDQFYAIVAALVHEQATRLGIDPLSLRTYAALKRFCWELLGAKLTWAPRSSSTTHADLTWDKGTPRIKVFKNDLRAPLADYEIERVFHEASHLLLDHRPTGASHKMTSKRSPSVVNAELAERQANALARELLVPTYLLHREWLRDEKYCGSVVAEPGRVREVALGIATERRPRLRKSYAQHFGVPPARMQDAVIRAQLAIDPELNKPSGGSWLLRLLKHAVSPSELRVSSMEIGLDSTGPSARLSLKRDTPESS